MRVRGGVVICVVVAALVAWFVAWRESASRRRIQEDRAPTVYKEAVVFASRTFDPAAPPVEMPPLGAGENAECDSDFRSSANVRGETRLTDASHATVTITQVTMTLRLNITVWVPMGAAARVVEHEAGHREISEYYYQGADKLAQRTAARYLGRQVEVSGLDLEAATNEMLLKMANAITDEYGKELDPGPTQLLYDTITDHGRNDVVVKDAVEHALKNVSIEGPPKAGGN